MYVCVSSVLQGHPHAGQGEGGDAVDGGGGAQEAGGHHRERGQETE